MDFLHVLRSEPDALVRRLIQDLSRGKNVAEVPLYQGKVDYDQLVKQVFDAKKVICWW
jgi:hypothetical protein